MLTRHADVPAVPASADGAQAMAAVTVVAATASHARLLKPFLIGTSLLEGRSGRRPLDFRAPNGVVSTAMRPDFKP